MWRWINLLFLVLSFFTGHVCCDDSEDDYLDHSDKPTDHEGGDSHEKDDDNYEGHRNGKMLIVVIPVVGVLVLIILVTCGICILKKYNNKKIKTQNYQDKGTMDKHQLAFPTIVPDNPPPYTTKMEEGQMKSPPMEFPGYSTGWYAPGIVSMPPPYTQVVGLSLHPDSTAAPGY